MKDIKVIFDKYPMLALLSPLFVLYCTFVMLQIYKGNWLIASATVAVPFMIGLLTEWREVSRKDLLATLS